MLKKLRIWYWITTAFLKKYAVGLLVGVLIGTLLAIYGDQLIKLLPSHRTIYIGKVGSVTLSQLPMDVQTTLSKGLLKINDTGEWELDAAESMNISDDGKVYTLKLRPNQKWSNGERFASNDIELAITDVNISKPDESTIVFTLKEPFAPFPVILSQPLLKKVKVGFLWKKTQVVGLQNYSLQTVQTTNQTIRSVTLKTLSQTKIYKWYPTEEDALLAYKLGQIDILDNISAPYLDGWANSNSVQNQKTNRHLVMFFNVTNPSLQDKTIRQMLAYATPKKTDESRIISPISMRSWTYNPQVKPYAYNAQTAKAMLDKLQKANPNIKSELTITTISSFADIAQQIIDAWQKIGIQGKLRIVSYPDTNDYEILLIGQQVPDDPDQYPLWHSTQSTNITHYQNPKIDKLLEDGRKETNKESRKEIYQDFQRFLVEDCPAVFLQELPTYTIVRKSVGE